MRSPACVTIVALSLLALPARAQTHNLDPRDDALPSAPPITERIHMALDYAGAPGCAEPGLFKDAVRVREYRWDPFAPSSPWRLRIRITRKGPHYDASGELRAPNGAVRWRSTFRGPFARCYDVISALALDLVIAIKPRPAPPPPPSPPPAPPPPPAPACPDPPLEPLPPPLQTPEPKVVPEPSPLAVRLGAAVWSEIVVAGWGSLAFSTDVGVRYRGVSLTVEAHGDPPIGSLSYAPAGEVSFAKLSGRLLLCAHWGWFAGCGVGDLGRIWFPNHAPLFPASTSYGAAGVRLGLEFPVAPPRIFLRTAVDLLAPIRPARLSVKNLTSFEAAGPSVGLGLGVLVELSP